MTGWGVGSSVPTWTSAVSRADFWPPVSASKNSVPGKLDFEGQKAVRRLGNRNSGRQKCRFCSDEIGCEERQRNRHIDLTRERFELLTLREAGSTC
jgi:hypothetical protein